VKKSIPREKLLLIGVPVFGLLIGLLGYFALVAPQKSKAASLSNQIAVAKLQAEQVKTPQKAKPVPVHAADLFRLTKAMPDSDDVPGILLDLARVAKSSDVSIQSVAFTAPVPLSGYGALPTTVIVKGSFPSVAAFLHQLRREVWVDGRGNVHADDRLLIADNVNLAEASGVMTATLSLNAFVYGLSAPSTTTTSTDTTTTTTTTPSGGT